MVKPITVDSPKTEAQETGITKYTERNKLYRTTAKVCQKLHQSIYNFLSTPNCPNTEYMSWAESTNCIIAGN